MIMNKYIISGSKVVLNSGLLELDLAQSMPRLGNLRKIENNLFEILREVQFKRGEVIGYDGFLSKAQAEIMEVETPVEVVEVKQPAKKPKETSV